MNKLNLRIWALVVVFSFVQNIILSVAAPLSAPQTYPKKPKLILTLVIDQFRADYLTRFQNRFLPSKLKDGSPGGFQFLRDRGAYFPFGEYGILQSMTGPGHATILSGSYPYQAGIPVNTWFNPTTGKKVYCVEDPNTPIVSQKPTKDMGSSPKNYNASTVGDELKNAGYPSKVVALALKDRAAILMGGHRADLAFWFDERVFEWVSSTYYLPEKKVPAWMGELNQEIANQNGKSIPWDRSLKGKDLENSLSAKENYPSDTKRTIGTLGQDFPHTIKIGSRDSLASPFGVKITVDAAIKAAKIFKLGQSNATDILAVSISSHDYVAHRFGPNSSEAEEMTITEDRELSRLFKELGKIIPNGLNDVIIVLTADHGVAPNPDWLVKQHPTRDFPAGRIDEAQIVKKMNKALTENFGKPKKSDDWIIGATDLNFYFSPEFKQTRADDRVKFETVVKDAIQTEPGVAWIFGWNDYEKRHLPPEALEKQILRTYVPIRSGDFIVIPKPYWINSSDTAAHMTGYSYDKQVPILISGPGIKKATFSNKAEVVDIAPTLSYLLGITYPAMSEGRVLSEAIQ